jgi:hypothetical protein
MVDICFNHLVGARDRDVFFYTEEFHTVVPAEDSPCGISAVRRNPLRGIPQGKDGGGLPWRDDTVL